MKKLFSVPVTAMYCGQVDVQAKDEDEAIELAIAALNAGVYSPELTYMKGSLQVEIDCVYCEEEEL